MRNRVATMLLLMTACGCAGRSLLNVRAPVMQAFRLQPAVARGAAEMAPVIIPAGDRDRAWNQVVDVVDDHFTVAREAHGQAIGDNLLTAGQIDAASGISRRGFVRMIPVESGFLLDVTIFKEVTESNLPQTLIAQTGGPSEDRPFGTPAGAEAGDSVSPHWIPAGRDESLEDDLLSEVRARFDGTGEPSPPPAIDNLIPPDDSPPSFFQRTGRQVWNDHKNYYALENLGKLAAGVGVAAVLANSQFDREFAEAYQDQVRNASTNSFARIVKPIGNGGLTVPLFAVAAIAGEVFDDRMPLVGEWGNRSLRATGLGFPLMLLLQKATGGSRPKDDSHGSRWIPWKDNNGVSGHAFMGAMPFLTAAQMTEDPSLKAVLYFGSTLTGWSRVNDDAHFFSQVALGWWMAYLAASAIDLTNLGTEGFSITPLPIADGMGVGVEFRR